MCEILIIFAKTFFIMKKLSFVFLFILLIIKTLTAQENNEVWKIRYDGSSDIQHFIFSEIAKYNSQSISSVEIQFSFSEKKIIQKKNKQVEISVEWKNLSLTGSCRYRNFLIDKALIPTEIDFEIEWKKTYDKVNPNVKKQTDKNINEDSPNRTSNVVYQRHTETETLKIQRAKLNLSDVKFGNSSSIEIFSLKKPDTLRNSEHQIKILSRKSHYSAQNREIFEKQKKIIDNYYSASQEVKENLRNVENISTTKTISVDDLEKYQEYKKKAAQNLRFVETIKRDRDFMYELPLKTLDPENILQNLETLRQKSNVLKQFAENIEAKLPELLYQKGKEHLTLGNNMAAEECFRKSIEQNSTFAPSHLELAKMEYQEKKYESCLQSLYKIAKTMNSDSPTRQETINLARKIYSNYLDQATQFNNSQQYEDANAFLEKAAQISKNLNEIPLTQNWHIEKSRIISVKYKRYLTSAQQAMEKNNFSEAERYISLAKNFQIENSRYISDVTEFRQTVLKLYYEYISLGDEQNSRQEFENALSFYQNAKRIAAEHQLPLTKEYENGILIAKTGIYDDKIEDAQSSFDQKRFEEATNLLSDAYFYQEKSQLKLSNKATQLANRLFDEYFAQANAIYNRKEYSEALLMYEKTENLMKKFSLQRQNEIRQGKTLARNGIFYNEVKKSQKFFDSKEYEKADLALNEAVAYQLQHNPDVSVEVPVLRNKIRTELCRNHIAKGKQFIEEKRPAEAIKEFESAKTLKIENNLSVGSEIDALSIEAAKLLIKMKIEEGKMKVSSNELSFAKQCYMDATQIQLRYRLSDDQEVKNLVESFNNDIFNRECQNIKNKIDTFYQESLQKIQEKKFIESEEKLKNTLFLAKKNSVCEIDTTTIREKLDEISPAAEYERKHFEVNKYLQSRNYQQVIDNYVMLGVFHKNNFLSNLGIEYLPLTDFLVKTSSECINYATRYFIIRKEWSETKIMFSELQNRDFCNKDTKENQIEFAKQLAIIEKAEFPTAKYEDRIEFHTKGQKWYKHFKKAYKKQWKSK